MKLKEKGYTLRSVYLNYKTYSKKYNGYDVEVIVVNNNKILCKRVVGEVYSQKELDNVQIALNNLERDLK